MIYLKQIFAQLWTGVWKRGVFNITILHVFINIVFCDKTTVVKTDKQAYHIWKQINRRIIIWKQINRRIIIWKHCCAVLLLMLVFILTDIILNNGLFNIQLEIQCTSFSEKRYVLSITFHKLHLDCLTFCDLWISV